MRRSKNQRAGKRRRLSLERLEHRRVLATFLVNSAGDAPDFDLGDEFCHISSQLPATQDDAECTLRAAIQNLNERGGASNQIDFVEELGSVPIITSGLPPISRRTTLDGEQFARIIIEGVAPSGNGLVFANGGVVRNLVVRNFGGSGVIFQNAASELTSTIVENNNGLGVYLQTTSNSLLKGNLIRDNAAHGVQIEGGGNNTLINNEITDNAWAVRIASSPGNSIGGAGATDANEILRNSAGGIRIEASSSIGNRLIKNIIGDGVVNAVDNGNLGPGVSVDGAIDTVIGGAAGLGNTISGNDGPGIILINTQGSLLQRNLVGLNFTGAAASPNEGPGILVAGGSANHIGGSDPTSGNVSSGNLGPGIVIEGGASSNLVSHNIVGLDSEGDRAIGNAEAGVFVGGPGNTIGGDHPNLISGNQGPGVLINGGGASNNLVQGNGIGVNSAQDAARPNTDGGVVIADAPDNVIQDNLISGNAVVGVAIIGVDARHNRVSHNGIGVQGDLLTPLGNAGVGVFIGSRRGFGSPDGSQVGGAGDDEGNLIAHNDSGGVVVGDGAGHSVLGNSIFNNNGLGIDLGADGPTPNDLNDADAGANDLQNTPSITRVTIDGDAFGLLNSDPDAQFRIEVFASDSNVGGEGQRFLGAQVVTTDEFGDAFFSIPVSEDFFLSATATRLSDGSTSEFSPLALQADLQVENAEIDIDNASRAVRDIFAPVQAVVLNNSDALVQDVDLEFRDGDGVLIAATVVSLEPREHKTVVADWNITPLLDAGGGLTDLEAHVIIDPSNEVEESDELNNESDAFFAVDARPVLSSVRTKYRSDNYYLAGVFLANNVDAYVADFNGNLPDNLADPSTGQQIVYRLNGTPEVVNSQFVAPAGRRTYDLDEDLQLGVNRVEVHATSALWGYQSDVTTLRFTKLDRAAFLKAGLTIVATLPGRAYDNEAHYTTSNAFPPQEFPPGLAPFPVDSLKLLGGDFGLKLGKFDLFNIFKSTGSGEFKAELPLFEAKFDKKILFGPAPGAKALVTASGRTLIQGNLLTYRDLAIKLRGEGSAPVLGKGVPIPALLGIARINLVLGMGVDGTLPLNLNNEGQLEFGNTILGVDGTIEGVLSIGVPLLAELQGTVGGGARIELFIPPPGPDEILKGFRYEYFAKAEAIVGGFSLAKYETHCRHTLVGTVSGGEGCSTTFSIGRKKRVNLDPPGSGEHPSAGLPQVTFPVAAPSLAQDLSGGGVLLWIDDDPDKADDQYLELMASAYDGQQWSPPAPVTDDTMIDLQPTVAFDEAGDAVAVWSRLNATLPSDQSADLHDHLGDFEIAFAVYDPALNRWSVPALLTDNNVLDHQAITASDPAGNLWAGWLRDADNQAPLFPHETTPLGGDILAAQWTGAGWGSEETAAAGVNAAERPDAAVLDQDVLFTWSEDVDGDPQTIADRQIHVVRRDEQGWTAPMLLEATDDGHADVQPRIALDSQGSAHAVWVKRQLPLGAAPDRIFHATSGGGAFSTPAAVFEADEIENLKLVRDVQDNLILSWQEQSSGGVDLFYAVLDRQHGDWSPPLPLTSDAFAVRDYTAVVEGGQLHAISLRSENSSKSVAFTGGELENTTFDVPVIGDVSFAVAHADIGPDLQVDSVSVSDPNALPGETVQISASVLNTGSLTADASTVRLVDGASPISDIAAPTIPAGGQFDLMIDWTIPDDGRAPLVVAVLADADGEVNEVDEANNQATFDVLQPNLKLAFIESIANSDAGGLDVLATVVNEGGADASPFTTTVRLGDPQSGNELAVAATGVPLAPGEQVQLTLHVDAPFAFDNFAQAWVIVDSGQQVAEHDETDNEGEIELNPFASWKNEDLPSDINNDNRIRIDDAFLMIDYFREHLNRPLPFPPRPGNFWDPNADFVTNVLDPFIVIADLRAALGGSGNPEGERESDGVVAASGSVVFPLVRARTSRVDSGRVDTEAGVGTAALPLAMPPLVRRDVAALWRGLRDADERWWDEALGPLELDELDSLDDLF